VRVIHFTTRTQGLMVARGNPLRLRRLEDLAGGKARFVNRQPGSGTRLALDHLLHEAGLRPANIRGYAQEEHTHLAVAATIASGHADAGLGIEAAAREFKLDFIPLFDERYLFACRKAFTGQPLGQALLDVLTRPGTRQRLQRLPGYAWPHLGATETIGALLATLASEQG
jgi:molybdate-binding protein